MPVYEEIHISPSAYLKEYRLQMACTMLRNTSETITTVSQNCGFHSASYFGKVFRSQMGCTPYEFKNKIGGGKYNEL
ncbi:helix-turn-helix transcriptional regulator [Blautia sp.]|uniref:helix-turn-helix transcriptional regulator n=1 Tax=Blautia sp. TaxID=1955243 RepID=UPI003AB8EFBC